MGNKLLSRFSVPEVLQNPSASFYFVEFDVLARGKALTYELQSWFGTAVKLPIPACQPLPFPWVSSSPQGGLRPLSATAAHRGTFIDHR